MQELIARVASGDTLAAGDLYELNQGLIRMVINQYSAMCETDVAVGVDDLEQVGYFAVIGAARTWQANKGSWSGWLVMYLRKECNEALGRRNGRFLRPERGALSLDMPISEDGVEGATMLDLTADDTLPPDDELLLEDEVVRGVRAAIGRLPEERQRRLMVECELHGKPYADAAEGLGITLGVAYGDRRRAFKALRRDKDILALKDAYAIQMPGYSLYKGVRGFQTDWTSTTEGAALRGM